VSESTKPFQVVTGSNIVPQQPFAHLYQHIRQRDPKLAETIDRLAQPAALNNNLSNPLQGIEFVFLDPLPSDKTNWVNVLSNVATDESLYYPLIAYANVTASSSTDIELDIQISHDGGLNFISILANLIIIPAGDLIMTKPLITFTQGAYLRNLDLVYAQLTSSAFDGGSITLELLFQ
jgi:hypothetical protein